MKSLADAIADAQQQGTRVSWPFTVVLTKALDEVVDLRTNESVWAVPGNWGDAPEVNVDIERAMGRKYGDPIDSVLGKVVGRLWAAFQRAEKMNESYWESVGNGP